MEHFPNVTAVVLAAGKGTRMKSELPKVATLLAGKPLVLYVLDHLLLAGVKSQVAVVGYKKQMVEEIVAGRGILLAEQQEQLGTGHAVLCSKTFVPQKANQILVACGDAPLIQPTSFRSLINLHNQNQFSASVLTAILPNPTGYGRILRNPLDGTVNSIVEEKDASPAEKNISEVNTGTYIFEASHLWDALNLVGNSNAQGEYYLTDVIHILKKQNKKIGAMAVPNPMESHGINSPADLELAEQYSKSLVSV